MKFFLKRTAQRYELAANCKLSSCSVLPRLNLNTGSCYRVNWMQVGHEYRWLQARETHSFLSLSTENQHHERGHEVQQLAARLYFSLAVIRVVIKRKRTGSQRHGGP